MVHTQVHFQAQRSAAQHTLPWSRLLRQGNAVHTLCLRPELQTRAWPHCCSCSWRHTMVRPHAPVAAASGMGCLSCHRSERMETTGELSQLSAAEFAEEYAAEFGTTPPYAFRSLITIKISFYRYRCLLGPTLATEDWPRGYCNTATTIDAASTLYS